MKRILGVMVFAGVLLLVGCEGIGRKYSTVTIKTDSSDAQTYLVPIDSWNKLTSSGKPLSAQVLAKHRQGQGGAVVKSVPAFKQVVVVERGGKFEIREFTPSIPECEITVPSPR